MIVKHKIKINSNSEDKIKFISEYSHRQGLIIKYTDDEIQALDYTDEEREEKEKTRIASLTCTKRVLALALKQLGISYTQLKELIATDEDAQLEWDLCVELQRSNPFLDIMGSKLGIDPTTIDKIFRIANGEEIDV